MRKPVVLENFIKVWWFTGRPDNLARVLSSHPYCGKYPEYFNQVLRVEAPNTKQGWVSLPYHTNDMEIVIHEQVAHA